MAAEEIRKKILELTKEYSNLDVEFSIARDWEIPISPCNIWTASSFPL